MKPRLALFGVAVGSLLAFSGLAYADCAWVLWTTEVESLPNGFIGVDRRWTPSHAYGDERVCNIALAKLGRSDPGTDNVEFKTLSDGTLYTLNKKLALKCLPDTVDPRGAKGK